MLHFLLKELIVWIQLQRLLPEIEGLTMIARHEIYIAGMILDVGREFGSILGGCAQSLVYHLTGLDKVFFLE